jgi:hypothetical protein
MNENEKSSSSANRSPDGKSGKPGSGGRQGATSMVRKGIRIETSPVSWGVFAVLQWIPIVGQAAGITKLATTKIKTTDNYFFTNPSNTYAASGIEPIGCSRIDYKPITHPDLLAICQLETEYLKFTNDQSSKLVHSGLMNRPFLYHIMNGTSEMPSLRQLIERVEVLTPNEPLKYVGGNEILLRKMLPAIDSYSTKTETEQLVASFTRAAVLSAIYRHKAAQQKNIVVDLQGFLEQSISVSNEWESLTESLASQVQRKKLKDEYTKTYESRIKQANEVLVELQKDIEVNHVDMKDNIEKVLAEIDELKNKNQATADDLNQESLKQEQTLGILKLFTTAITMVATSVIAVVAPPAAPFVGVASTLATTGLDFAENTPAVSINPGDRVWANALAFGLERSQKCNKNPSSNRRKRNVNVEPLARSALDIYKKDKTGKDKMKLIEEAQKNNRADMHNLNREKDQISCLNGEIIDATFTKTYLLRFNYI